MVHYPFSLFLYLFLWWFMLFFSYSSIFVQNFYHLPSSSVKELLNLLPWWREWRPQIERFELRDWKNVKQNTAQCPWRRETPRDREKKDNLSERGTWERSRRKCDKTALQRRREPEVWWEKRGRGTRRKGAKENQPHKTSVVEGGWSPTEQEGSMGHCDQPAHRERMIP